MLGKTGLSRLIGPRETIDSNVSVSWFEMEDQTCHDKDFIKNRSYTNMCRCLGTCPRHRLPLNRVSPCSISSLRVVNQLKRTPTISQPHAMSQETLWNDLKASSPPFLLRLTSARAADLTCCNASPPFDFPRPSLCLLSRLP
jgi:hypothetical protein